jgi:hypothetical protein
MSINVEDRQTYNTLLYLYSLDVIVSLFEPVLFNNEAYWEHNEAKAIIIVVAMNAEIE